MPLTWSRNKGDGGGDNSDSKMSPSLRSKTFCVLVVSRKLLGRPVVTWYYSKSPSERRQSRAPSFPSLSRGSLVRLWTAAAGPHPPTIASGMRPSPPGRSESSLTRGLIFPELLPGGSPTGLGHSSISRGSPAPWTLCSPFKPLLLPRGLSCPAQHHTPSLVQTVTSHPLLCPRGASGVSLHPAPPPAAQLAHCCHMNHPRVVHRPLAFLSLHHLLVPFPEPGRPSLPQLQLLNAFGAASAPTVCELSAFLPLVWRQAWRQAPALSRLIL